MKKLKLDKLSSKRFDEKDLKSIKGGEVCGCVTVCGCRYANQGGSSTNDNANANAEIAATNTHNAGNETEA